MDCFQTLLLPGFSHRNRFFQSFIYGLGTDFVESRQDASSGLRRRDDTFPHEIRIIIQVLFAKADDGSTGPLENDRPQWFSRGEFKDIVSGLLSFANGKLSALHNPSFGRDQNVRMED